MSQTEVTKQNLIDAYSNGELVKSIANTPYPEREDVIQKLAELINDQLIGTDFISVETLRKVSQDKMRSFGNIFEDLVPQIPVTYEWLINACHALIEASEGAGSEIKPVSIFEGWLKENLPLCPEIFEYLENQDRDSHLILATLISWSDIDSSRALEAAIELTVSIYEQKRMHAILALGYLKLNAVDLERANKCLRTISRKRPEDMDNVIAVRSINRRLAGLDKSNYPTDLVDEIRNACVDASLPMRDELLHGLLFREVTYPNDIEDKIFDMMSSVRGEETQAIDIIDSILYQLDLDKDRVRVLKVITDLLTSDNPLSKIDSLDSTVSKLQQSEADLQAWYACSLLLSGNHVLGESAPQLYSVLSNEVAVLSLKALSLSDDDLFYLARKIFGYFMFAHGAAVSLLAACLFEVSQKHRKDMERLIFDFWVKNYPGDLELFEKVRKINPSLKTPIGRIKKAHKAYLDALPELRQNSAFKPSPTERQIYGDQQRKMHADINKHAEKSSFFASLFHTSHMLYGRAAVTYVYKSNDAEPERHEMKFQTQEVSTQIPRMDILYPERLSFLTHQFRSEQRPK